MSKEKQIEIRGWGAHHPRSAEQFLNQVIEAAKDGYVLHPKPTHIRMRANLLGFPTAVMVTEEYAKEIMSVEAPTQSIEPVVEETNTDEPVVTEQGSGEDLQAVVEALSTKDDMFVFAKDHGLEIPADKKVPKAIQKWLLDQVK